MFARNVNHQSTTATGPVNGRRALRDVTNAKSNVRGKGAKIAKRSNGVKTRSVTVGNGGFSFPGAFSERVEDRNPMEESRNNASVQRSNVQGLTANPNSYQMTGTTDHIDERDHDDPLCTTSYVNDMYLHFRSKEASTSVRPLYMEKQEYINERMRSILVDWLVEVHLKFKLVPETLYLTINLIDRYLQKVQVSRPRLQLVGVTSLLIASKYEEILPPELRDLVYICDKAYTKQDILDMEVSILKALKYNVTIPSAHCFLVRYLKAGHADKRIVQLSCYLLDGTLQSYSLLHYMPSQLAAAAVFIARRVVGRNAWSPTLLKYAKYCEEEVIPVARAILNAKVASSDELRAVNKKYSSSRYGGVTSYELKCDF